LGLGLGLARHLAGSRYEAPRAPMHRGCNPAATSAHLGVSIRDGEAH
jgi:hypothetical protein